MSSPPDRGECVLELAHDHMGLDAVRIAELEPENWSSPPLPGTLGPWGLTSGRLFLPPTPYSRRLVDGVIPGLIPDLGSRAHGGLVASDRALLGVEGLARLHVVRPPSNSSPAPTDSVFR